MRNEENIGDIVYVITRILVIIFWNFKLFQYRSDSPQIKRNLALSITNLLYELPPKLPNEFRLRS